MSTTMTEEDVMRKIGALLRHIEVNENPNEVAVATLKLQKFMLDWNISEHEIAEHENRPAPSVILAERFTYSTQKARVNWQVSLLGGVCKSYFGKCITHHKTADATILAEKMNLVAIKAVYNYLRDEILRLEDIAFVEHVASTKRPQHRRGFWNQFCNGAMSTIYRRMEAERLNQIAHNNKVNALVVLKDKLIEAKQDELFAGTIRNVHHPRVKYSAAYVAGKKAGESVPLKPGARQIA